LTVTAWRITKRKYAAVAFTGEGAELTGGRWNSTGTRMVYSSSSAALAVLEILVHLQHERHLDSYVLIPAQFDEDDMEQISLADLPAGWAAHPVSALTQRIGDEWVRSRRSLVLQVPSVVVPFETNYLINPGHPGFDRIEIGDPLPLALDERLLAARSSTS
jgi:RES domain-containing protein